MHDVHVRNVLARVAGVGDAHVQLREAAQAGHDAHRRPELEPKSNVPVSNRPGSREGVTPEPRP